MFQHCPAHTHWVCIRAAVVAAVLTLSGCALVDGRTDAAPSDGCPRGPAEVVSEAEIDTVASDNANLVLDVNSTTRDAIRVIIRVDGAVALDVRTPAWPSNCTHPPTYSQYLRLPNGPARVTVDTGQDQHRATTVVLDRMTQWVAVQPQDRFPIGLTTYDREPVYG